MPRGKRTCCIECELGSHCSDLQMSLLCKLSLPTQRQREKQNLRQTRESVGSS